MGIFDNILEFFKDGNFKKYLINETIKAYHDKPDTVKDIDKYIKDKICNGDKVSIIKFIEFFKDAINYTKWFDDNKELMDNRTINKSKASVNLFDSDYTDGSVIDMLIGGDTDNKKLFEDAITKILTVLKKPSDIKDLNVLTLCVMTKINHYLAKFSFYMCVKNVEISRVNKIADIMGSFIMTKNSDLISNYENEICKLLKCKLTDLETFVNKLPISEIMDKSKAYKDKYINLLTDVYNFNTSNENVKKQYEEFKTYNSYKDCVNNFKSNIGSVVKGVSYNSINENIKNNNVFDNVDHNIITKFILQDLELKFDHHVTYKSIRDDVKIVYSFLPKLEAVYSSIADSTTFDTSKNEIEFSAWNDDDNKDKETNNNYTNKIKDTLQKFIDDITNYDFKFNFKDMLDNKKTDVKDNSHRVYSDTDIKTTIEYDDKLYGARYSIFPYNLKNFPSDDYIDTATILCIFYKYFKDNASDNYIKDCQNFITSYMHLQLYQTQGIIYNSTGAKLDNDDAKYNKDIIKKIVESRNILVIIKENIKKSINYIINEFIQYTCILNNKSYDSIDDAFKKQINIDNINYVDDAANVKNISDLVGFIYTKAYDDTKVKTIIEKITTTDKNDNIQNIYNPIHEFLEKVYATVNNNLIVYNITLNTSDAEFGTLKTKYIKITEIHNDIANKINDLITKATPKSEIKDNKKQTINTILSKSINADYVKSISDNIYELTLKTKQLQDVKDVLNRKYYDKFIDENKYDEKTLSSEIKEYNKTLNVFGKIYDNTIITNKSTCSAQSDTINNLLELIKYVDDTKIIDDKDKDSIKNSLKGLIKTSIKELTNSYNAIYEHVNENFLSGFNKFKNGLIKSTDDVVIQHVWFNALRKIHNIQSIQDIEKTEKPKNKHNILSLVNRKSTEIPKGDSQLIDKFFLNNHVPFNAANITSRINKISGGNKDDIECMNIYEQIFKRIQDILASRKIKLNAIDTERINDKIKKLKRTEKRLLEIFKTMAYYTSIPDLTRRSDVSYDDMNETIDEYKHKYEEYHKLTDNMINSLNKLNKIVTEITNNINA